MRQSVAMGLMVAAVACLAASADVLEVDTVWSHTAARPGDTINLAVIINLKPGWHVNSDEAQQYPDLLFNAIPTVLTILETPKGVVPGATLYPKPKDFHVPNGDIAVKIFEHRVIIYVPITIEQEVEAGLGQVKLGLSYQSCNDAGLCLEPRQTSFDAYLSMIPAGAEVKPLNDELFVDMAAFVAAEEVGLPPSDVVSFDTFGIGFAINGATVWGLLSLLLLAGVGGFLLNLTPCVLPVIPIKIMGLSQSAGNRGKCFVLGLVMSLGVVVFWLILGAAVAFVSGFTATNQLFQYPAFTLSVGVVIAIMAVGMCGLFAIRLPQFVYSISPKHDTMLGSFGFGIMTAVLSTPCTAPFMGSVAAWATTQVPSLTMITFAAIGAGMALPYLVLAANPALVDRMPRSGSGGELIKQIMGLLMLAAAAYFLGVGVSGLTASSAAPPSLMYWWPVALLVATAGAWLMYRCWCITQSRVWSVVFFLIGMLLFTSSGYMGIRMTDHGPINWVYYTPERFRQALDRGNILVLDFTAEWCLNCKVLEHSVLHRDAVVDLIKQDDVVAMKVDFTSRNNSDGRQLLERVGGVAIPLLVVFDAHESQVFKSHAYTAQQVIEAVRKARR